MFGLKNSKNELDPPPQGVTTMGPYGSYPQCALCGWKSKIDKSVRCCPKCGSTEVKEVIGRWSYRLELIFVIWGFVPYQKQDKFHPKSEE